MFIVYDTFPTSGANSEASPSKDLFISKPHLSLSEIGEKFSIDVSDLLCREELSKSMPSILASFSNEQIGKYGTLISNIGDVIDALPEDLKKEFQSGALKKDLVKLTLGSVAAFLTTLSFAGTPAILVAILLHKTYNGTRDTAFRHWIKEKFKGKLDSVQKQLEKLGVDPSEEASDTFVTSASNFLKYLQEVLSAE